MNALSLSSVYSSHTPGRLMIQHAPLEFLLRGGEGLKLNIITCQNILFGMLQKIVQSLCIPYVSDIQFVSRSSRKCSKTVIDMFSCSAVHVHYLVKHKLKIRNLSYIGKTEIFTLKFTSYAMFVQLVIVYFTLGQALKS
jgi:hypothetical protein